MKSMTTETIASDDLATKAPSAKPGRRAKVTASAAVKIPKVEKVEQAISAKTPVATQKPVALTEAESVELATDGPTVATQTPVKTSTARLYIDLTPDSIASLTQHEASVLVRFAVQQIYAGTLTISASLLLTLQRKASKPRRKNKATIKTP